MLTVISSSSTNNSDLIFNLAAKLEAGGDTIVLLGVEAANK